MEIMLYYIAIAILIAYTGLFIWNCMGVKPKIKEMPLLFILPVCIWILGAYIWISIAIDKLRGK